MSERTSALSQDEAIRLFQFFEGNGSRDKQQMISLTTWLLPFAFGLIAYSWKAFIAWWGVTAAPDPVAIVAGAVAIVLAGYAVYIVREFLIHAEKNFRDANDAVEQIENPIIKNLLAIDRKPEKGRLLRQTRHNLDAHYVGTVFLVLLWFARLICALSVVSSVLAGYTLFRS